MKLSRQARLIMLLLNWAPLLHLAGVLWVGRALGLAAALLLLYGLPPLCVRSVHALRGKPSGCFALGGSEFFTWWVTAMCEMVFARLPFLEELLRLVPGLYSAWLRLWGARVGSLVFWAPGTRVLDKSYLEVGHRVTLGAGVRLNGHVIAADELTVAAVRLEDGCTVGGYSLLTAGCRLAEGESLRACTQYPPFTEFVNGKRKEGTPR